MTNNLQILKLNCRGKIIEISNYEIESVELFKNYVDNWSDSADYEKPFYLPFDEAPVNMFLDYLHKNNKNVVPKKIQYICEYLGVELNIEDNLGFKIEKLSEKKILKIYNIYNQNISNNILENIVFNKYFEDYIIIYLGNRDKHTNRICNLKYNFPGNRIIGYSDSDDNRYTYKTSIVNSIYTFLTECSLESNINNLSVINLYNKIMNYYYVIKKHK